MSDRDYYEILGLTPRADGAMVDQTYWHLARKYQQMAAIDARARYMLDELNEAYGVLGTPRLREQYDAFRDDVLLRAGMIRPVKAKSAERRQRTAEPAAATPASALRFSAPRHWRTYASAGAIVLLGFAGAWSGVNAMLVLLAMTGGLAVSLAPVLRRQLPDVSLTLPNIEISAPRVSVPEFSLPRLGDAVIGAVPEREEGIDPDHLRSSTAAMIARWRNSVGLKALAPSTELVEITESERALDDDESPVNAALEILRRNTRRTPV
jgi:hypothetical protein